MKNLRVFYLWIQDQLCFGLSYNEINLARWTAQVLIEYVKLSKLGEQEIKDNFTPPTFDPSDWDNFETHVFILFDSTIGQGKHCITYLLHDMALAPANTRANTLSCEDKFFGMRNTVTLSSKLIASPVGYF